MPSIGIYIHIPFCRSKCGYCDFYSLTREDLRETYVKRVTEEILTYQGKGITANTLFIGGGTPSLLTVPEVEKLVAVCQKVFSLSGEITMEANPDSVSPEYLIGIRKCGINRISFGAQSGVERELKALGRRHNVAQIEKAVYWAREAGFYNLSLDIMLGIPYQTTDSLTATLSFMLGLQPEHLSCYLLKIEEGTPFANMQIENLCADEDRVADFYLQTVQTLQNNGYPQYEISNFSKVGYHSQHNLKYWQCEEYLGFGAAAHSFWKGKRFYHSSSVENYLSFTDYAVIPDGEGGGVEEQIFLRLRLSEGLDLSSLPNEEWGNRILQQSEKYRAKGLMKLNGQSLSFTPKGFLVSNRILAEFLSN